jgi:long-chain fatty acid transport protein
VKLRGGRRGGWSGGLAPTESETTMRMTHRYAGIATAILLVVSTAKLAHASSGLDSPENGVVQMGRGNAWIARADDPLAAYYNPAAMSFQASGVHVGAHLMFQQQCFDRRGPGGALVSPGGGAPAPGTNGLASQVCTNNPAFPNPQIAGVYRITDKLAIGLAVVGPHGVGTKTWPETVGPYKNAVGVQVAGEPAPQRYSLISASSLMIFPTISASYAFTDNFSIGAGFIWGIASVEFVNFSEVLSSTPLPKVAAGQVSDDFDGHADVKGRLNAKDLFIPGFVVSALWSPADRLDVSAWFKWQDAIRASTDLHVESHYWNKSGSENTSGTGHNDTANQTDVTGVGTIKFNIPMEARLGVRYHHPRANPEEVPSWAPKTGRKVRDPLSQDVFDVELDFTWANNSVNENLELRFLGPTAAGGIGGDPIAIHGLCATCFVPPNGDIPHNWRDVFGARLGGDVVILPNRLALRAGGWLESKLQDDAYLSLDFPGGMKAGLSGGATLRLGPVDVSAGYQHTFFGVLDNGGDGQIRALSGDSSVSPIYRSQQTVNGGKLTTWMNEVALGGTVRF